MNGNQAQAEYWSSAAGLKWIEHERALDVSMAGMLEAMLVAAKVGARERVLDVGCGTGASTIAAAQRASGGQAVGMDISGPLLARATERAKDEGVQNASFLLADAQNHSFSEGAFDLLVSRIGMSFFEDSVAALRNLATSLRDGGRMAFVCWAAVQRNPWFQLPKQAAETRLGILPPIDPRAPGPTAFQEIAYVIDLMTKAGLRNGRGSELVVWLTPPDGVRGAARVASSVGPAARVMKAYGGTEIDAQAIENSVAAAFDIYEDGGVIRVPAVVNLFTCVA